MFFKLIKYDLRIGIARAYKKYLVTAVIFLVLCVDFLLNLNRASVNYGVDPSFTISDIALYCFAGMEPHLSFYLASSRWMLIYIVLFYITLSYPHKDLTEFGQNILIRSGSRSLWWLSKCIWCIVNVIIFFATAFLVITISGFIAGGKPSLQVTEIMTQIIYVSDMQESPYNLLYPFIFILPLVVSIALCLLQTSLALLIKPLYSFAVMVTIMIASVYYFSPFMLGGYTMPIRSDVFALNGLDFWTGFIFSAVVMLFSIFIGLLLFRQRDIMKN